MNSMTVDPTDVASFPKPHDPAHKSPEIPQTGAGVLEGSRFLQFGDLL